MNTSIKQNSLNNPKEVERLLAQYAGIFPFAIREFGEAVQKRNNRPKKNYSR